MKLRKTAAVYSILVGLAMIVTWIVLLNTNQVPELETAPLTITMHIAAEFITAIVLLIGGIGLLLNRTWSFNMFLLSMGMLIYAVVNASGAYAQQGNVAMIAVFIAVIVLSVILTGFSFVTKKKEEKPV
jgi:hypothetical protein